MKTLETILGIAGQATFATVFMLCVGYFLYLLCKSIAETDHVLLTVFAVTWALTVSVLIACKFSGVGKEEPNDPA